MSTRALLQYKKNKDGSLYLVGFTHHAGTVLKTYLKIHRGLRGNNMVSAHWVVPAGVRQHCIEDVAATGPSCRPK